MRLTSEEHQKLRSNLQKIEDYIVSEICPHRSWCVTMPAKCPLFAQTVA